MRITTYIKEITNRILKSVGLKVVTTRADLTEKQRLRDAQQRGHWDRPRFTAALNFQADRALKLLKQIELYAEAYLKLPLNDKDMTESGAFYLNNGWFGSVDAEILYGIIRANAPAHIVEVGSGNSTRLMWQAIREGNLPTKITSIDPQPRIPIVHPTHTHVASPVEQLQPEIIVDLLQSGDILFIDSSHQIVAAGDVPYLILEVLPRLRPGVWVHIHDVFLPFDYPELFVIERRWTWNEQYLVHAFLCFNTAFEIVWPAHYMWVYQQPALTGAFPGAITLGAFPTSLWLRKLN